MEKIQLTKQQLLDMTGRIDTGSNALFNENLGGKRKHVACIQDLEEVSLYAMTGNMIKGGIIELPELQCARGTTSLESFVSIWPGIEY